MDNQNHFIVISFPAQGHLNPTLQFAKRLLRTGAHVTYVTTLSAHKRMLESSSSSNPNTSSSHGLTYAPFSDGYDDGFKDGLDEADHFLSEIERRGSQALRELIKSAGASGGSGSVTCIIYAILVPWVAEVARDLQIPSVLLWIQPAMVFDIYYYYYNGYKDVISNNNNDPSYPIDLPNLPLLTCKDIPTFFLPTNLYTFALPLFEKQFEVFEEESKPVKVLVNTFDELESDALRAVDVSKISLIPIGPLIPSAFLDGQDLSDKSFGGDLVSVATTDEYKDWLDSKEEGSVIYVSFGSVSVLERQQMEEIFRGLTECGFPYLWVCREKNSKQEGKEAEAEEEESVLSRIKREGSEQGKIVSWCAQVEVLSHPSIGCFITHCGWNSTLESLVGGVPLIGFPQWTDQGTNAKLIEDVWKIGVRMRVNEETKIVGREEVSRCVKIVMGNSEMKRNAKKWKELAKEAANEGGSSDRNLKWFVETKG
ncbi:hypothetical protein MKW94_011625 [Papaver nudicaule]|uniref:Glycosyltransferase n=1 Tax=Papaver nudicaule TaxID=74823 RepID=A0AA41V019_PAPNU|nr:hypothetical protein [Papaver nudicaule]